MKRPLTAALPRFMATYGALLLRIALALVFAWFALLGFDDSVITKITGTAFDYSAQVLSILSAGRLTDAASHPLLATWELLIALGLLVGRFPRIMLWLLAMRLILALLPLAMRGDDVFRGSYWHLSSGGHNVVAYALLLLAGIYITALERFRQLASDPRTAAWAAEEVLTPDQHQQAQRALQRRIGQGVGTAVLVFAAFHFLWPRYLAWFHARQEAGVMDEKLSGKMVKKSMPFSPLLKRKITTWVYLPPGYQRGQERYPVVYVMHGAPGEVRDCFVKGRIQDTAEKLILAHKIRPLIIVGWDGQGPTSPDDVSNFLDRVDGSWSMESFITRELVPYIDRTYRTQARPEMRALDGVSAGGYAAINLLLKHPDIWKVGSSHTGFLSPTDDVNNMTDLLGPPGKLWDINNPMKTVHHVSPGDGLHVYVDIGQGDELLSEFDSFCRSLESQKIDHACHVFPGRHTWDFWSKHFADSLLFADRSFSKVEPN